MKKSASFILLLLISLLVLIGCNSYVPPETEEGNTPVPEQLEEEENVEVGNETIKNEDLTVIENKTEQTVPIKKNKSHTVEMVGDGFPVESLTVRSGDTVQWFNNRENGYTKAMIIGTQGCSNVKSNIFNPGEFFKWKFDTPLTCTIVDGIYTTKTMKVVVQ